MLIPKEQADFEIAMYENHMADMEAAREHFIDTCMQSIAFSDILSAVDGCKYKDEFIATICRQKDVEAATSELVETLEQIMREFFEKRFIGRMR